MKVDIDGRKLLVSWKHMTDTIEIPAKKPGKEPKILIVKTTECYILPWTDKKPAEPIAPISEVSLTFDPGTCISRNTARKESLRLVLEDMFPGHDEKETRRKFWEIYDQNGRGLSGKRKAETKPGTVVALNPEDSSAALLAHI